ncbi:MAG: GNAT family protein [Pseudomonadota bacterium]
MSADFASPEDFASQKNRRALNDRPLESLPPAVFPGRLPLAGPRVALEPIDPRKHAEGLFAVGHEDETALALWDYLPYGPFADTEAMTEWLRGCAADPDTVFFALRDMKRGGLAGMASFLEIRPLVGVYEIGHIWFAPPFQNSVLTTEALFLMMDHGMTDLEYRRLEWKCNALNTGSRSAALRLGFRFEGVFFNHNTPKGRNRDTAYYAIIDSEWPAVRENFVTWLAEDNFDGDGRQKTSLGDMNRALW